MRESVRGPAGRIARRAPPGGGGWGRDAPGPAEQAGRTGPPPGALLILVCYSLARPQWLLDTPRACRTDPAWRCVPHGARPARSGVGLASFAGSAWAVVGATHWRARRWQERRAQPPVVQS